MKLYNTFILITILSVSLFSCKKESSDSQYVSVDSMRLVHNVGFAPSADPSYFMITGTEVKEDTSSPVGTESPSKFDKTLSSAKHAQVKDLLDEIPQRLFNETGSQYRTPNSADCGGTKVTAYKDGQSYEWYFEDCTMGMEDYVRPMGDMVFNAVQTLKNQ